MFFHQGLEEPQTILGVYSNPKLPSKRTHFPVTIKHLQTPNEVVAEEKRFLRVFMWKMLHSFTLFLVCLQVFLSLLDSSSCEQESLEEALGRVNRDIESLPHLTDFPIGNVTVTMTTVYIPVFTRLTLFVTGGKIKKRVM